MNDYNLDINFIAAGTPVPDFSVWRRECSPNEPSRPSREIRRFSLPTDQDTEERAFYWVTDAETAGYQEFRTRPDDNVHLTRWLILRAIIREATSQSLPFDAEARFHEHLEIEMASYREGVDLFVIEPYYLKSLQQFGILADFRFRKDFRVPFNRVVQQRSLSLTPQFRRNVDRFADKAKRIRTYLNVHHNLLCSIRLPGSDVAIQFESGFTRLPAFELRPRTYEFGDGQPATAQYPGVREFGPFQPPPSAPRLLFVFLPEHRQAAVRLANALSGKTRIGSFPGFERLFRSPLEIDPRPVKLPDFGPASIANLIEEIRSRGGSPPVTVLILPDRDSGRYLDIKSWFAAADLPTQGCTLELLSSDETLQWSVANIGLQIFCKAGGLPWRVQSSSSDTLILGVSQSHKRTHTGVERFFAFSVLTDNSGVFRKVSILSDSRNHRTYIDGLESALREELANAGHGYTNVAIHASFRMRKDEMDAIGRAVKHASQNAEAARFTVLKINQESRFFGLNQGVNGLVPYEASVVELGGHEFLIWFEGISRARPTVNKVFSDPTHVQRIWDSHPELSDDVLMQDLVNLSGANWRGFNARNAPVSMYYCQIVANLVHDFHDRGLASPTVEMLTPWFL